MQKQNLTHEQRNILFNKATEKPFTGKYLDHHENGMFLCTNCGTELFSSDTKFESGTGWPSFYDVAHSDNIELLEDITHGMERIEVVCKTCGGHLGHVFDDGPEPTGKRYCINSCVLDFKPEKLD